MPSATSPATSVMRSPTAASNTVGAPVRVRPRVEERRHQRVRVEVAAEVELLAVVPRRPRSRASRARTRACAARGATTASRSGFSMCGLIWLPRPSVNRPFETSCRSLADVGHRHRVAGERDRDLGDELEALGVLGRDHEREEWVVGDLGGGAAVVAVASRARRPPPPRRSTRSSNPSITHTGHLFGIRFPRQRAARRHPLRCHTPAVPSLR